MCGRMTLSTEDLDALVRMLEAELAADVVRASYRRRYNVAPTDPHWIVRGDGGRRLLSSARWGLGGPAAAVSGRPLINARAETVAKKPAFRDAVRARRCLVPADGFYEWRTVAGDDGKPARRPLWLHPAHGGLLRFAGLWEPLPDGQLTFTVITTPASDDVRAIHDRMPAILDDAGVRAWLAPGDAPLGLLVPAPSGTLAATPVAPRVNSVKNDDPACLAPDEPSPAPPTPAPKQLRLF